MQKRGTGILFLLALLIAAGALFQDFRFDSTLTNEHTTAVAVEREFGALDASLASFRAAQTGYVATGQVPASWMTRANERLQALESALLARKTASSDPDALKRYDAAVEALTALKHVDGQIRSAVDLSDRTRASELVFQDAEDAASRLSAELGAARTIEQQASIRRTGQTATLRIALNGAAVLLIMVITAYFGRSLSVAGAKSPPTMAQMIRDLPPPVKTGAPTAPSAAVPAQVPVHPPAPAPAPATSGGITTSGPLIHRPAALAAAAELCVDLARLLDSRDIPALLERASSVLDAKGIMIWSLDAGEGVLRPSLAHGYSEKVTRKIRPLPVGDENITSQALRSLQPQTMAGAGPGDAAAIAIPLISSAGCVGVMAAEIRQSRPHSDVVSLARIIAAQFTTLVAPGDDALGRTAEA